MLVSTETGDALSIFDTHDFCDASINSGIYHPHSDIMLLQLSNFIFSF
jgi:hypothetical protein